MKTGYLLKLLIFIYWLRHHKKCGSPKKINKGNLPPHRQRQVPAARSDAFLQDPLIKGKPSTVPFSKIVGKKYFLDILFNFKKILLFLLVVEAYYTF